MKLNITLLDVKDMWDVSVICEMILRWEKGKMWDNVRYMADHLSTNSVNVGHVIVRMTSEGIKWQI